MKNLENLIDQIHEIEQLFIMDNEIVCKRPNGTRIILSSKTIRKNPNYLSWKSDIEFEISQLPESPILTEIQSLFKKIHLGYSEETDFSQLKTKLITLKKYLPSIISQKNPLDNKYSEEGLCQSILKALIYVQKTPMYRGKTENELNDAIRNNLSMIYTVYDQTRQGKSTSGKDAGEIDILINKDALPFAIIEALYLSSLESNNLNTHINKVLTKYDPIGCPFVFILIYFNGVNFSSFLDKLYTYLQEYNFPYEIIQKITKEPTSQSEFCHFKTILNRNNHDISVHFYVSNLSK